ncbi:MAG TPA: DUF3592 domain-containing protein [Desulfuromonadales bacterium]|nr:DUF3592 domain-containing protein [Desulfuromonadales bacterium]
MKGWLFFICWVALGLALLCWGITLGVESYRFKRAAVVLDGRVVDIRSTVTDSTPVYSVTVEYRMPDGTIRRHDSNFGTSTPSYSTGDSVKVLLAAASGKIKLDSFGELYFPSLIIILVAGFVLLGPAFCLAVWVWIWGWPTHANLNKMKNAMTGYLESRRS